MRKKKFSNQLKSYLIKLKDSFLYESLLLLILGCLSSLSLPPFNYFLINFLTYSILLIILFNKLKKKILRKFIFIMAGYLDLVIF